MAYTGHVVSTWPAVDNKRHTGRASRRRTDKERKRHERESISPTPHTRPPEKWYNMQGAHHGALYATGDFVGDAERQGDRDGVGGMMDAAAVRDGDAPMDSVAVGVCSAVRVTVAVCDSDGV